MRSFVFAEDAKLFYLQQMKNPFQSLILQKTGGLLSPVNYTNRYILTKLTDWKNYIICV